MECRDSAETAKDAKNKRVTMASSPEENVCIPSEPTTGMANIIEILEVPGDAPPVASTRASSLPAESVIRPDFVRASSDAPPSFVVDGVVYEIQEVIVEPVVSMDLDSPPSDKLPVDNCGNKSEINGDLVSVPLGESRSPTLPGPAVLAAPPAGDCDSDSDIPAEFPGGHPGSLKRKAVKSISPPGERVDFSVKDDSEDPGPSVRLTKKGRRRRVISSDDDITETPPVIFLPAHSPEPSCNGKSKVRKDKSYQRTTRSGKCLNSSDEDAMVILDSDEEFNPNIAESSVIALGDSVIGWLNQIDNLRIKSKKLQGPIAGKIKSILTSAKEAVSTMVARSVPTSDVAYLKMRNKELTLSLVAVEAKNRRLSDEIDSMCRNGNSKISKVDFAVQTTIPVSSPVVVNSDDLVKEKAANISSGTLTIPPEVNANLHKRVNRFTELKAEMLQQIEDMSNIMDGYICALSNPVPCVIPNSPDVSITKSSSSRVLDKSCVASNKADKSAPAPAPASGEQWSIAQPRRILKEKRKVNSINNNKTGNNLPVDSPVVDSTPVWPLLPANKVRISHPPPVEKRKPPKKAAVLITATDKKFSYAGALKLARENISLKELGIDDRTSVRKAANGGTIIEVSGPDGADKADILADKLSKVLSGAQVRRPVKKAELRLVGLDDSVTPEEIKYTLAEIGATKVDLINTNGIRRMANGLGVAWVSLPLDAALRIAKEGKLRLGWSIIKVELMQARPLQCFKCWNFGHLRFSCKNNVDRSGLCFRCGHAGHLASSCSAAFSCTLCKEKGLSHSHRIGGVLCNSRPGVVLDAAQASPPEDAGNV